ncbi:MAG: M15 family metallopeptidase [Pyrinomonadaceae bacterium]
MSAKIKKLVWTFGLALIAANVFLIFGCRHQSAEQTLPIVVTNIAVNKTPELEEKPVENTNSVQSDLTKKNSDNSEFASVALQNNALKQNMTWTFGGKSQKGWYLYHPLICRLIGIETEADDNDFAEALSRWQKSVGLPPNGILDEAALAVIVTLWQSNRLKKRGEVQPNELQIGSTADFYDVSRPDELRQVERETYAAYKKMIAAAIADKSLNLANNGKDELAPGEKFLKIVSAFRSKSYQVQLRIASPNSGRAGLAVNSPHFTGRALDIYVGGEPVSTQDDNRLIQVNTPVYRWLVKNAEKFGFKPYFYEPWHWEYAPDSANQ